MICLYRSSNFLNFTYFADDTTVYLLNPDFNMLQIQINHELVRIDNWFSPDKLSLNIMKTKFMIVTNRTTYVNFAVKLRNSEIESVSYINFSGIYIDDEWIFKTHIYILSKRVSSSVGVMFRISHFTLCSHLYSSYCLLFIG